MRGPEGDRRGGGPVEGDTTLKTWDGFGHVLHCASEKAGVLTHIAGWMDERVA